MSKKIPDTPVRFMVNMMKPFKLLVWTSLIFVFIAEILGLLIPYLLKLVVDVATSTEELSRSEDIILLVAAIPLVIGLESVFWRLSGFVGMRWITAIEKKGSEKLYEYVVQHSHNYFTNRFAGSISNKVSNAAHGIQELAEQMLWRYIPTLMSFFISGALIYLASPFAGVSFFIMIGILIPLNIWLARFRRPLVVDAYQAKSEFKGYAVDLLTNISATRQYVRTKHELGIMSSHTEKVRETDLKQWFISEWILAVNSIIILIGISVMMWVLTDGWLAGSVTTGDFVLVVALVTNLIGTLTFIGGSINHFVRLYGEIEEGLQETLLSHEIREQENAKVLTVRDGVVEFKDVDFSFDNINVFDAFSLSITKRERVGLVGHSGAGKTTFVSLLLRQHDLDGGEILIDGQNIASVTQDSLRQNIAVVPQEPLLFHRSIGENIAYGNPEATQEQIEEAAKKAQAHDFVMSLPEKYETLVGERGVKLSGGQKQRVAIARAILKDAPILVLDEATSALDSESEVAIQKALEELMEGKTVIAVAHRLSTLRKMDRIIVLEEGGIVEDGTHEQLAKAGGVYQKLWEHQAGGFLVE